MRNFILFNMFNFENLNESRNPEDIIQQQYDDPIKNAVWNYVAGYTTSVNNILRKDKTNILTKELDEAFNEYGESDITDFYRTVDWDYMKNIYGVTKENIREFIGKTFINKGYMSTSSEFQSPWGSKWNEWELVIHMHGDTQYININNIFDVDEIDCEDQNELLLPRNTRLKLESIKVMRNKEKTYLLEMVII